MFRTTLEKAPAKSAIRTSLGFLTLCSNAPVGPVVIDRKTLTTIIIRISEPSMYSIPNNKVIISEEKKTNINKKGNAN